MPVPNKSLKIEDMDYFLDLTLKMLRSSRSNLKHLHYKLNNMMPMAQGY